MAPLKIKLGLLGGKRKKGGSVSSPSPSAKRLGSVGGGLGVQMQGSVREATAGVRPGEGSGSQPASLTTTGLWAVCFAE